MVYIILGEGFEEIEALAPCDLMRRAGIDVSLAGIGGDAVRGGHGIRAVCDCRAEDAKLDKAELIVVPGGLGGVASIRACRAVMDKISAAYRGGVPVSAICAGPGVLADLGILGGKRAVCYPGMEEQMTGASMTQEAPAVRDGNVITGRAAGASIDFALELISFLRGAEAAETVRRSIYYGV